MNYVELPRYLPNLELLEPNEDDMKYLKSKMGNDFSDSKIAVLISEQKRFYIVATFIKVEESDMDIFELPFSKLGL